MYYELTDEFQVVADGAKTWEFFSDASNLPLITPPWLAFKVHTPSPITIGRDTQLDYSIRWSGFPIRWRTKIIDWSPPQQFVDLQVRGPYAFWHHLHHFTPAAEGTHCVDRVIYKLPFGLLGSTVQSLIVRRQLLEIFRFRREVIREHLGWVGAPQESASIKRID